MRVAQNKDKNDLSETIKKVTEMQEMQGNSTYMTQACEIVENRIKEAHSPQMLPKTVIEMVEAAKQGERCNFENFANDDEVKKLNARIRKDRVFLMHNRRSLKRVEPKKPGCM